MARGNVQSVSQVPIPDDVRRVLGFGPEFAVEPKLSPPELIGLVLTVSRLAPEGEVERCISEGVDVIARNKPVVSQSQVKKVVSFLKEHRLSLFPADKEGGFVVLTEAEFGSKALEAISSVFNRGDDVSRKKLRLEAVRRCKMLNLHRLAQSINTNKDGCLQIMVSAKTHKGQCPLRVIVSEMGSWQKPVALFLQDK